MDDLSIILDILAFEWEKYRVFSVTLTCKKYRTNKKVPIDFINSHCITFISRYDDAKCTFGSNHVSPRTYENLCFWINNCPGLIIMYDECTNNVGSVFFHSRR